MAAIRADLRSCSEANRNDRLGESGQNYRECVLKWSNSAALRAYRERASSV
jgi:hypothetical protein